MEKLRYLHRNPVKRGLVASPELWQWSSFRAYALGEVGVVKVNQWDVLKLKIRPPAEHPLSHFPVRVNALTNKHYFWFILLRSAS